eukprot:CAMPEP_0170472424 /NCGR_PEP_ID=MMETSP0123-20130129/14476_1 /TAXON_ID=182087 /ORGANISM="Favella ehrenbergii, Strain Fehren 1" /LENGTH=82 /DNA_ID=CAMNT_0010740723 /DNA_START=579 /DNA_END=827 /DNA_ORIENTATION=+
MASQFDQDFVPELLNEREVDLHGLVVPHLLAVVARSTVDVAAYNKLAIAFLVELLGEPGHLAVATVARGKLLRFLTVVIQRV